ncbi:MAG: hypothetical protein AAF633_23075, partial [Chloroflexota bacterium]
ARRLQSDHKPRDENRPWVRADIDLEKKLNQIPTGKSTQSKVEYTPPSPRPIRRRVEDKAAEAAESNKGTDRILPEKINRDETQKKTRMSQEAAREAEVETEIGALPADLWHLIGEDVPETQPPSYQIARSTIETIQQQPETTLTETPTANPIAPSNIDQSTIDMTSEENSDGIDDAELRRIAAAVYRQVKNRLKREQDQLGNKL